MNSPMDRDELLALEDKRDAERLMWAEANVAFRADVGLVIEIAKASAKAYENRQRKLSEREGRGKHYAPAVVGDPARR